MEIVLKKPHVFVTDTVPAGKRLEVTNRLGKELIEKGIARPVNFIDTTKDKINAMFTPKDKELAIEEPWPETKPKTTPGYKTEKTPEKNKRTKV